MLNDGVEKTGQGDIYKIHVLSAINQVEVLHLCAYHFAKVYLIHCPVTYQWMYFASQ